MGGCASKQTDDERDYMGASAKDTGSFSTLFELHKGVCKVGVEQGSGFGFLCRFPLEENPEQFVHGLITNNYTLNVQELQSNDFTLTFESFVGGEKKSFQLTINPRERFRFTCPILDATFVHLKDDEIQLLKSRRRLFLTLSTNWEGARGEEVLVVQQQVGFKTRFANGTFLRYHGFDILHTSSSDVGSWGSPLALRDGQIIGLHKRKAPRNTSQFDIALSTKALVVALHMHCKTTQLQVQLVSNPIRFNPVSETRIVEHGLAKCAALGNRSLIFVSPEDEDEEEDPEASIASIPGRAVPPKLSPSNRGDSVTAGLGGNAVTLDPKKAEKIDASKFVSPLWFSPTSHGWYWTPTDPFDRTQETNWMSISTRYVVGGVKQHGKRMLKRDIELTRWLKSTGGIQNKQ